MDFDDLTPDALNRPGLPRALDALSGGDPSQKPAAVRHLRGFIGDNRKHGFGLPWSQTLDALEQQGPDN